MNVLHVDSSILGEASASRALSGEIVRRLRTSQADLQVTYVDLAAEPLPHYSAASLAAGGSAEGARDAALLAGFLRADVIVIGAPLYNFSLPSQLKAWVDRIVIRGKTFRYTAQGPQGLAGGKRVILAIARGGVYAPGAGTEFGESYLKFVFNFLGITDLTFVRAEGLNVSPETREQSLQGARASIQSLSPAAAAALAA
jgi:FMN-dependent NADH-azoreductase